jgi:hypothetical protein
LGEKSAAARRRVKNCRAKNAKEREEIQNKSLAGFAPFARNLFLKT